MATPQVKDLVLRSPAGSSEVVTFSWPLQIGSGQDKHDNGIDIIDTIKFVCEELPGISSAFEEINLNQIDTACYKTMTNLVDRFNKAVDSIVALEKGTSLPTERLNKFAHPSLLRHILQLVYNAAVLDPDKLNNYEPFSPEVYGETSYELVQQMIKHVNVTNDDTFIDLGSGVGQVVLQMAGSFPLKTCVGIEKADTPARYAERMDTYFRQFMAWFGKRYCDYKLLKGDFLVDEHREKITTSSLVFVNNFAFGPNVDHQLKERFADLRDGARIVSSKSFCPLNFRITDRNLSDIGTIMHVSEIPPLKGSVSWTCKPVSYYLHVIDRTILERYFQRLKTQKGAENEHIGSTRTTRDRAKREANNQAALHHNSNSNSNSATAQRTNSPATINNNIAAPVTKTRQQQQQLLQQQQQQQQQQRNLEMDTSTESDGDAATTNGGGSNSTTTTGANTNGGGSNGTAGPTTRKVWSDWCSSKGKSSQSDEENNNFSSTTNSRSARATTQKKRKKLTRKAAIASKSAAAAQREAAAREREAAAAAAAANSKESSAKEDAAGTGSTTTSTTTTTTGGVGRGGGRKGRMKKGAAGGRGKKSLKINGLDVLHKQTVLSTTSDKMNKKLPTAPGCVDQKLTALLTANMSHEELDIPAAPQDTPYALQILLDVFRSQYMSMIEQMKAKSYVPNIKRQIQIEQERKQRIKNRASQLDKQIKVLIDDSVALLKVRMNELGINVSSPNDLIAKAKEIVGRHKELQGIAKKIQSQVSTCEVEQKRLLKKQLQPLPEYQKLFGNGKTKLEVVSGGVVTSQDLSEAAAQELILREIANTLAQRKKLYVQVSNIEKEATVLEQAADERRTAAALLAQGTNMTLTNAQPMAASANQPLQLTANNSATALTLNTSGGGGGGHGAAATKSSSHAIKPTRRSRDHRTRSQEWPDVPDVGKIEESNPEVLAQKILETGRQIEAGKFTGTAQYSGNSKPNNQLHEEQRPRNKHQRSISSELLAISSGAGTAMFPMGPHDSALMPAPAATKNQVIATGQATATSTISQRSGGGILPKCEFPGSRKTSSAATGLNSNGSNNNIQESPKVANFEDRLKSIITSALNEDQEQRKATQHQQLPGNSGLLHELNTAPSPHQSPAPKRSKHSSATSTTSAAQHLPPPQAPNNLSNIINVATQGLTHLNATTTISPITPPLAAAGPYATANVAVAQHYSKYGSKQQTSSSSAAAVASSSTSSAQKYASNADTSSTKYHHHHVPPPTTQQQQQHLNHMQQMHQSAMHQFAAAAAAGGVSADLAYHRRRSSVSASSSYEHFATAQQQQQHQQALMLAAAAAAAQQQHQPAHSSSMLALEFKAPTAAEHLQRSSSRDMLLDEANMAPRSSSANSDSAVMYFPPTRDRLMSLERSTSRESALSQPLPPHHQQLQLQPSRPNSNSSQPDYTQVSPAKMALRRHLSQEKLNQQHPAATGSGGGGLPMSSKTIGDLVNGEIERTLEISHQSIINAVVNMSTVGANVSTSSNSSSGGLLERNSYVERGSLFNERERDRSNERAHERLLINPNAQRPERVHVRVIDDHPTGGAQHGSNNNSNYAALEISPRSGRNESHNLSTLAHVAYNHKPSSGTHEMMTTSGGAISMKMSSNSNSTAATTSRSNYNHRDSSAPYHHLPSSSSSSTTAGSASTDRGRGCNVASAVPTSSTSTASTRRDYQAVSLPRAEMKGCIEAYFNEEQQQTQQQAPPKSTKERSNVRNGRVNGGNPPLEGLAASLQDHVMASRKFKEEHEERQRRAAVAASTTSDTTPHHYPQTQHLGAIGATNAHHHQLHFQAAAASGTGSVTGSAVTSTLNHNGSPVKVEIGMKRTSPVVAQHPRPSKIPHYSHEPPMPHHNNVNSSQHHHHQQQQQQHHHHHLHQQQQQQQHQQHNSSVHGLSAQMSHHAMMSAHNPYAHLNGTSTAVHSSSNINSTSSSSSRRSKLSSELMSPEINSIMGDEARANLQISSSSSSSSSRQQQQATPIVGGRAGDDDDVIADDETHWQHRVSSGFDRLVAFASTELDKTRRSIDTDTVPSSISCNTSPDSGITHSSSNSDAARTFLSTSSTCSQLEMPMGTSSNSFSSGYNNHHHVSHHHANDHLSDSSMKSTHSDAASTLAVTLKTTLAASPADASAIESPSLSDIGLPRTPSPNGTIATPPLAAATIAAAAAAAAKATGATADAASNMQGDGANSTLKIPLKYQRKSKSSSEKHYKKKFCERNWEYGCDELMVYSSSSATTAADAAGTAKGGGGVVALEQQQQQLKADKSPKLTTGAESVATSCGDATTAAHNEATHMLMQHQHQHSNHYHASTHLAAMSSSAALQSHHHHQHQHHHHKSSKFRPKGKDWDWSLDSSSVSKNNKANTPRSEAATTNSN